MTVKEIAQAVGKSERSVHVWIKVLSNKWKTTSAEAAQVSADIAQVSKQVSCKVQEAKDTSKPADYTMEETIEIIREGMGEAAAGVYQANATTKETGKLPNGSQLKEIRLIYGAQKAQMVINKVLGIEIDEPPTSGELGRISPQAYAVEMSVRAKSQLKQLERQQPTLFDGGHK
jgi:hypothetical protein